jgi:ABC-type transport system involved in cytochrome bd biosynthesis fused ATPase/permease subunit
VYPPAAGNGYVGREPRCGGFLTAALKKEPKMTQVLAVLTQSEFNNLTQGVQENNERLSNEAQQKTQDNLNQQKLKLQEQQLQLQQKHEHFTQKIMIGGLVIAAILVLSILLLVLNKIRSKNHR